MGPRCRFRDITLWVAITAGILCTCFCILTVADKYYSAHQKLEMYRQSLNGWEACRTTRPAFFRANAESINFCLKNLSEAQENFWVNLPIAQLAGIYLLAGLACAAGGFSGTWVVVRLGGLGVYKLTKHLAERLKRKMNSQACQGEPQEAESSQVVTN